uniref:Neural cell adhesion molecule 2 n=1 Tax=Ascaris suum TaxID=6253 RepID=F1KWP5_ASCSU
MMLEYKHVFWTLFVAYLIVIKQTQGSENSVVDSDDGKLRITPPGLKDDKYVVKSGGTFRVSCIFNGEDITDVNQLSWRNENDRKIDGESLSSLFTVGLHEHETHHKKLSLVFSKIAPRDAGTYTCVAVDLAGRTHRKQIHVVVVASIEWNEKEHVAGAMLGESLTIDCGASGEPQPEIEITDADGEPLKESEFTVAGFEVTIEHLTRFYQDRIIKCLAVQEFKEYDTTSVEQNEIKIDVWFAPEFASPLIERHAITGRMAILHCNTSSSNPPARHFRFLKDTKILDDVEKYELHFDVEHQSAIFKILAVEEDDFGEYICEANNGKAKSHQTIILREANPPDEVHASLYKIGTDTILWKIEQVDDEELPILTYTIEFIRRGLFDDVVASEQKLGAEKTWRTHGSRLTTPAMKNSVYEVRGLRQNTEYVFRLTAQNEAGSSDPVILIAKTLEKEEMEEDKKKRVSSTATANSSAVLLILAIILL